MSILAFRHHVAHILNAVTLAEHHLVPVDQNTPAPRLIADQNVSSMLNVRVRLHVFEKNAKILVQDLAVPMPIVMSSITPHLVVVQKGTLEIHSQVAIQNHLHVSNNHSASSSILS